MVYKEKSLGLEVAENDDEKFWLEIKDSSEKDISNLKRMLKFQEEILNLANSKLPNLSELKT